MAAGDSSDCDLAATSAASGRPTPAKHDPEPKVDPPAGKVLGEQYRVLEKLGAGGMGTVYLVEHVDLKKQFAAKVLNPLMASYPDAVARFEKEALASARLDHDNIVNIFNFGRAEG